MHKLVLVLSATAGLAFLVLLLLQSESGESSAPVPYARPTGQVTPPPDAGAVAVSIRTALDRLPRVEDLAASADHEPAAKSIGTEFVPTPGCTSQSLLSSLISAPRPKHLECIWDSRDFNPRHELVTQRERERFLAAMQPFMDSASELRSTANRLALAEFGQHIANGGSGLPFVSYERWLSIARARAPALVKAAVTDGAVDNYIPKVPLAPSIAFDFEVSLLREADGGWYACRMTDMATARPPYEAMAYTSLELTRAVIEFALQFGAIDAAEAEQLREKAVELFDRMIS